MKKRFWKALIVAAMLMLSLAGVLACAKHVADDDDDGDRLDPIDPTKITITETINAFTISWSEEGKGTLFCELKCNGKHVGNAYEKKINLRAVDGFVWPSDGKFNFSLIAKNPGNFADSLPTEFKYETEGPQLTSPSIISLADGVLTWNYPITASGCLLKINGEAVTDGSDELYHDKSINLNAAGYAGKVLNIELTAIGDNLYLRDSGTTSIRINAAHDKMQFLPITTFTMDKGVIGWSAISGAAGYRVVDVNNNVTEISAKEADADGAFSYDMTTKAPIKGIYPISSSDTVESADIAEVIAIKYLDGAGTAESPYLITNAYDMRAISYYEAIYAEKLLDTTAAPSKNYYKIAADIDYNRIPAADDESNMATIPQPFYGVLDGDGKKLANARVRYDGGYWALFDFIVKDAEVKNIVFDNMDVKNETYKTTDGRVPVDASVAAVAQRNFGKITNITLKDASFKAAGGAICGICSHNYGEVTDCKITGDTVFAQEGIGVDGEACYEMAGIVTENLYGGKVTGNVIEKLTAKGAQVKNGSAKYFNIRTFGGVVAVNRAGGTVKSNSYTNITCTQFNSDYTGSEYGGIIGYNGATASYASGNTAGTFSVNGATATSNNGAKGTKQIGKLIGKQE